MTAASGDFDPDVVFTCGESGYVENKLTSSLCLWMLMIQGGQIGWNNESVHEALTSEAAVERLGDGQPCGRLGISGNLNLQAVRRRCRQSSWRKRGCCGREKRRGLRSLTGRQGYE